MVKLFLKTFHAQFLISENGFNYNFDNFILVLLFESGIVNLLEIKMRHLISVRKTGIS